MVKLYGMTAFLTGEDSSEDGDIEIRVTGLRPGEKLYEELLVNNQSLKTVHPRINFERQNRINKDEFTGLLSELSKNLKNNNEDQISHILKNFNIGFKHNRQSVSKKY